MKKFIFSAAFTILASSAFSAVYITYDNRDSKGHIMKVRIDGAYKDVRFEIGASGHVTIQGGNRACFILTSCGEVEVNEGDKIVITDGCIKVYK